MTKVLHKHRTHTKSINKRIITQHYNLMEHINVNVKLILVHNEAN